MEEEDDLKSQSQSPQSNGRISIAIASSPPLPPLAIALPAQIPRPNGSGTGSFPSREDCWTEAATAILIDAWGERYLSLSRGNLKQQHWKEVADVVAEADASGKVPKTDVQCKNRIDTVKKKYKSEKARILAGGYPSRWIFFNRLDRLLGNSMQVQSLKVKKKKKKARRGFYDDSDSEPEPPSPDSEDSLPPETYPSKRARTQREMNLNYVRDSEINCNNSRSEKGSSMRELTRAIVKFGEMYEKAEISKVQQMVELEKQRMKFEKDMEMQRMQFFMKTQLELLQLRKRRGSNNHCHSAGENYANHQDHSDCSS